MTLVHIYKTVERPNGIPFRDPGQEQFYLGELREERERFVKLRREMHGEFKDIENVFVEMIEKIDTEINLVNYAMEYNEKKLRCPYFKRWRYVLVKDRKDIYNESVRKWAGDVWLYTNGRILAKVEIRLVHKMLNVSLTYENDTRFFRYIDNDAGKFQSRSNNYWKRESADACAELFKESAVLYLNDEKNLLVERRDVINAQRFLELMHLRMKLIDDEPLSSTLVDKCFYCLVQKEPNGGCEHYLKRIVGECQGIARQ